VIEQNGTTYFTRKELHCKHCGMVRLAPGFAEALLDLRVTFDEGMSPSSVCRCAVHNKAVGGHPRSLHVCDYPHHPTEGCCAMDVKWRDWSPEKKLRFARLAWSKGWAVGLHDGFCHIDRRIAAGMGQACFLYGTWSYPFTPEEVSG